MQEINGVTTGAVRLVENEDSHVGNGRDGPADSR
jgi:hypothetical protein